MKLTQSQLDSLLKALTLDVELVDDESNSDFVLSDALTVVDDTRSKILQPRWEQEHGKAIESAVNGKIGNIITRQLVDITGIDKSKLTSDMKDTDKIRTAIEHYKSTLQGDPESTAKKFQELIETHKKELEGKEEEWQRQLTEANDKYTTRDMREWVGNQLKDAPLNARYDKSVAASDLYAHLGSKYHMKWNEKDGKIEFYDKSNPNLPALKGNNVINLMDDAKEYFTARNGWETDMRNAQHDPTKGNDYVPKSASTAAKHGSSGNNLDTLNKELDSALSAAGVTV